MSVTDRREVAASTSSQAPGGVTADVATAPGVYGLEIRGIVDDSVLARVKTPAPTLAISIEVGRVDDRTESFKDEHAEISLIDDAWVSLTRSGRAHFVLPSAVPAEEVLHPWLVPAAATFNRWHRRHVLHGGAVARDGRAVAVLGNKEDGKSSLLAWLATAGDVEILTDDLIVIREGVVFPGPRCIDLRPESALPLGRAGSRLVRGASRLRMNLPPCESEAVLTALVVLAWGSEPEVRLRELSPTEGIASLLPHAISSAEGDRLLELVGLPVWLLERPRAWTGMPAAAEHLLALLA